MSDQTILSHLRDHRMTEANTAEIYPLDKDLLIKAHDRLRKIENDVKACHYTVEQVEERESIIETLDDIHGLRETKLMNYAVFTDSSLQVSKLLPHEAHFYQDVAAALMTYRGAVKP